MAEPTQRIERRLAAIFAADVAGYSRLMNQDEVGTLRTLTAHREIMDGLIAKHGGRIANTAGDSVLAEFPSVVDAVQCAVAVQQKLGDANAGLPDERRLQFRIGIHVGDVMVQGRDLLGDGVNIAARVQALAEPGGVWISGKAHDEIEGKLPHLFEEKGEQEVKGIARPIRVYALADVGSTGKPKQVKALPLPDKPSIAVLPFANLSGDPGQDYFADGIVEGVITGLCRTPWLFVIARNSSFTYKGRAVDVKQVGRELGVRYVLEGSLQRSANRVRINAQLVDAGTGAHLAAERFDGTLNDVFDLMDEVAAAVIGAIAPRLERAEIDRARRKPTESLDAYDLYLRGMAAFYRWNRESHEEALRLFVAAIDIAPDFAAAYGMAALCRSISVARGWMTDLDRAVAEGTRWAGQAVRFGQDDADTLAMAGHAISRLAGDLETGADLSERAVALNPNLAQAWLWGGWIKVWRGETDEAIGHFTRAMRLSPVDPRMFIMQAGVAAAHFVAGRYDEARVWSERAVRGEPTAGPNLCIAAASLALTGRLEAARHAVAALRDADPGLRIANLRHRSPWPPDTLARLAEGLRMAGVPE